MLGTIVVLGLGVAIAGASALMLPEDETRDEYAQAVLKKLE